MTAKVGLWEHFRNLASFKGREDRASFWPYAALVFGIVTVAAFLMTIPLMVQVMEASREFAGRVSDGNVGVDPESMQRRMMPSQEFLVAYLCATTGLTVVLYAAAVVRRLHDRGLSGLWGLMPLPFTFYLSIQVPRMFDSIARGGQPDPGAFVSVALVNLLYWIALGALVVLLAGAGDAGPNRYDADD